MSRRRWSPEDLFEVSGGYWQGFALQVSALLGIYDLLEEGPLTVEGLAHRLGASERGLDLLLRALVAMGLLERTEEGFVNGPDAARFLVRTSPHYVGGLLIHHWHLARAWTGLDRAVLTGRPQREVASWDEAQREAFLMGMLALSMQVAPRLARQLDLRGRRHLLDLGGGPGVYAIHFCLANPQLRATVFDLPTTGPVAERTINRFQLAHRIAFLGGDYLREELPGTYDVVWLSHVLHGEGPQACRVILNKAVAVLERGGVLLVHDFLLNESRDGPLLPALFSLNMLVNTAEGRAYSEGEIRRMMEEAGLSEVRRLPVEGYRGSGVLQGVRR